MPKQTLKVLIILSTRQCSKNNGAKSQIMKIYILIWAFFSLFWNMGSNWTIVLDFSKLLDGVKLKLKTWSKNPISNWIIWLICLIYWDLDGWHLFQRVGWRPSCSFSTINFPNWTFTCFLICNAILFNDLVLSH